MNDNASAAPRREEWLDALLKISLPVLEALKNRELIKKMPLDFHPERARFAPLEAFGRTMLGLSPWLETEDVPENERKRQAAARSLALECIDAATDPASPDFMDFSEGGQPLVDAAFLAHALVRAPKKLAGALSERVKNNLTAALISSRAITPGSSNWIFFSAMVEAGLYVLGGAPDMTRVLYAMRSFESWYKGDGIYGDGAEFHWDYYNSFVIQPMYVDLCRVFREKSSEIAALEPRVVARAARYSEILERMISPEGTYPVVGRSVCYRFGAFQLLSQAVLQRFTPENVDVRGVRCGLTAVLRRTLASGIFGEAGWLRPGVCGDQPELAEGYINVGSLYLCTALFLPLGLPASDEFWSGDDAEWSGKKLWSGGRAAIDHAL